MASEVESQNKHRLKISSISNSSNNNRQANYSQKQLTSNKSNMDNNQKKQVAPSSRQSLLPSTPPLSSASYSSTNKLLYENSSNQLNHPNHESSQTSSSSSTSSPDPFTLAVTTNRLQDQSDLQCAKAFQEKEQQQHQIDHDEEQAKHHVGPVMGIFFKVWSLVKVTKGRHHQKIRRQNSEDTSQFHYISGDQIGHHHQQQQHQSLQLANSQHHGGFSQQHTQMLEDRHFRRAGSQPAPSSSHRQQSSDLFAPPALNDRLLRVSSGQQSQQQQQSSAMSSGTNSTSSGVSSTTSSNLAPTIATQQSTPVSSSVRRHLSAYSLLRSTVDTPTPSTSTNEQTTTTTTTKISSVGNKPPTTSWTSKIKRSATTVNQTDFSSYVSKYRSSRRANNNTYFSAVNAQKHVVSAPPVSLAKATPTTNHGFFRRKMINYSSALSEKKHTMMRSATTKNNNMITNNDNINFTDHSDDYGEDDLEGGGEEEEEGYEEEEEDEELVVGGEEDDSNDIYSTPNDSIQSVPSTAPVICSNNDKFSNNFAVHQASNQVYPIIKSFSTNNFGQHQHHNSQISFKQKIFQKTSSQDTNSSKQNRFESIDEFKVSQNTKIDNNNNNFQRQDSSQSNSKRLNGSRFFISSSSSEDSNSPSNQQQQRSKNHHSHHHNHHHHQELEKQSRNSNENSNNNGNSSNNESDKIKKQSSLLEQQASFQLEQQQNKLAIQHGVHYHNPTSNSPTHQAAIIRPDSLILAPGIAQTPNSGGALFLPVSLQTFTPTSTGIMVPSGGAAAIAAMSPIDSRLNPSTSAFSQQARSRLNLIEQTSTNTTGLNSSNNYYHLRSSNSSMLNNNNQVHYKKSPSLFEIHTQNGPPRLFNSSRFNSRYPISVANYKKSSLINGQLFSGLKPIAAPKLPSSEAIRRNYCLQQQQQQQRLSQQHNGRLSQSSIPNSISLYDYKSINQQDKDLADFVVNQQNQHRMSTATTTTVNGRNEGEQLLPYDFNEETTNSEYKFAKILLESGSNLSAKDSNGYTALMHAVLSDNIPAIKCLIEHQVSLNDVNDAGFNVLDLICSKFPTETRVEILKIIIENNADLDKCRDSDGSRLLDRLIYQHDDANCDKLAFIECLLQYGAKIGSSTWLAANGKYEIQLRLIRKLCQDGYYLYKKLSIEAAVYRFEYAIKRIAELEQQLAANGLSCNQYLSQNYFVNQFSSKQHLVAAQIPFSVRQLKYQAYLGLSRCERKRKFYKRALEFAHMAILVDSTAYEGYYSKAHILKDLGEIDDSLMAIDQTSRLVDRSIENIKTELEELQRQQEALLFDGCFNIHDSQESNWIEATRIELIGNIDYMEDAKKYILRLKDEILDDKLGRTNKNFSPEQDKPELVEITDNGNNNNNDSNNNINNNNNNS